MQYFESEISQIESSQDQHRKNVYRTNDYSYRIVKKADYDQLTRGQSELKKDRSELENERDKYRKLYENEEKLNKIMSQRLEENEKLGSQPHSQQAGKQPISFL